MAKKMKSSGAKDTVPEGLARQSGEGRQMHQFGETKEPKKFGRNEKQIYPRSKGK